MADKMSVAEGMQELKRIDKLIDQRITNIRKYSSKRKGAPDEIKDQEKFVASEQQSAFDLLERYLRIKTSIQRVNLDNFIEFDGKKYSIADLIIYKKYLAAKKESVLDAFSTMIGDIQLQRMSEMVRSIMMEANRAGNDPKQALDANNLVVQKYYDETKILKEKEHIAELLSRMNVLIDKNNHSVMIEV